MHLKYLVYMSHFVGIFSSSTNLALTSEVEIAVGCAWAYIYNDIWSRGTYRMLAV